MSTRAAAPARVYLHTLGCPKNEADTRALKRVFAAGGIRLVDEPEQASHILINTCGFIQDAKEESIGAILDACASYPAARVLVVGCLVERYREELVAGMPEVAGWYGLVGGEDQAELIRALAGPSAAAGGLSWIREGPDTAGASVRSGSYAYLKISDGCDELCTFCAIPGIKGSYHSFSAREILREADACLAEGAKELVLVGQDTSLWTDGDLDLAGLVQRLAADARVSRIRIMYLQPEHISDGFLRYMAAENKLCRYLDVPFQHSHPDILRRMGRRGDASAYLDFLDRARRLMPDLAVRSTFIVGFPGEEEHHFEHLLDFIEAAEFDYAGGFIYSPEEGTTAATLKPRVRRSVARERLNRLNALLARSVEQKHQELVGRRVAIMVDSLEGDETGQAAVAVGRSEGQAPEVDGVTYIEGALPEGTSVGDVIPVTISAAVAFDLVGSCDAA